MNIENILTYLKSRFIDMGMIEKELENFKNKTMIELGLSSVEVIDLTISLKAEYDIVFNVNDCLEKKIVEVANDILRQIQIKDSIN